MVMPVVGVLFLGAALQRRALGGLREWKSVWGGGEAALLLPALRRSMPPPHGGTQEAAAAAGLLTRGRRSPSPGGCGYPRSGTGAARCRGLPGARRCPYIMP